MAELNAQTWVMTDFESEISTVPNTYAFVPNVFSPVEINNHMASFLTSVFPFLMSRNDCEAQTRLRMLANFTGDSLFEISGHGSTWVTLQYLIAKLCPVLLIDVKK